MRRRNMIMTGAVLLGSLGLLTGCVPAQTAASSTPTASATSASPTPSPTPTPSASPSASSDSSSGAIPASCDDLGTAATRDQTVGDLTAQHSGGFTRPAPANASTALSCNWIQEESKAVLLIVSTASPADVTAGVANLVEQDYSCQAAEDFGAQYCVKNGGTVDTEDVVVARDGTWIYLETDNVNARAWLSEISSQIFG